MDSNLLSAIPAQHTRFVQLPNEKGHNAVWDFVRSPDDRFYISVCGENEKPLSALLYEYFPATGELRLILDVEKIWIVDSEQMPPSKIHTSIDFLQDGRLIMATHNTAPAPGHKQWLYEQHYEHPWEGYPGSIVMIVNPDTNEVFVRGIPVPRESIYGGILGNDPRYYYFLGYMRGHFYRLNLETNEVRDYGKVSEFSSCRLVKDDRGRIYGSSYTGALWRYEPDSDEIKDLKVSFESPNGTKYRRALIFTLQSPKGTLFLANNLDGEIIELHPETLEVTRHGHIHLRHEQPNKPYLIGGLAADDNFVLYYGLKIVGEEEPIRLVRWDILNGGEPENLGLITVNGKQSEYICEMIFDRDGWLHLVDVCGRYSPFILAVDVKMLQPPGADAPPAEIIPFTEPDMYMSDVSATLVQIDSKSVRTLPLHQYMNWRDTAVKHVSTAGGKGYCISGQHNVIVIESDCSGGKAERIEAVYDGGGPLSCLDGVDGTVIVLTTDRKIVRFDLVSGNVLTVVALPVEVDLVKLHSSLDEGILLATDRDGALFIWDSGNGELHKQENIRVSMDEAHIIRLDDKRILLSGSYDEMFVYDLVNKCSQTLDVRCSSIKGRAFRATMTGGAVLADGTVVGGTADGMLFSLSADLQKVTSYGRLYSSGQLRNFITVGENAILGVYGGVKDAGHVFYFSQERGFVDLGRPRVIKDNAQLYDMETEWANIHYISCLAYVEEDDYLYVASGEEYGCVVRYKGVAFP
ncbi:hypothetical protein [Cohnella sp.]|uniref:hypothetical protein n=1 Tax=Cohnella sp. TaxID=1883426 RepID=UPI00356A6BA0